MAEREGSLMESVTMPNGDKLKVHDRKQCAGRNCCIHNPSDTPMKDWPLNWRPFKRVMERICPCGVGHDDVDDLIFRYQAGRSLGCHGCCPERCCESSYGKSADIITGE
jgi:hypothetical protein